MGHQLCTYRHSMLVTLMVLSSDPLASWLSRSRHTDRTGFLCPFFMVSSSLPLATSQILTRENKTRVKRKTTDTANIKNNRHCEKQPYDRQTWSREHTHSRSISLSLTLSLYLCIYLSLTITHASRSL